MSQELADNEVAVAVTGSAGAQSMLGKECLEYLETNHPTLAVRAREEEVSDVEGYQKCKAGDRRRRKAVGPD